MEFNPFKAVSNYPQMLRKIALFTFISGIVAVKILRSQIPEIEFYLSKLPTIVEIKGIQFSLGTVLPAFILATLARVIKLHDRVSDLFKIRQHFDVNYILLPLVNDSGTSLTFSKLAILGIKRRELMSKTFYKYASSGADAAKIDPHYVTMALDQWSWYWIILESLVIATITLILLIIWNRFNLAIIVFIYILLSILLLQYIMRYCIIYARQQVDQILSETNRKNEVAEVFNEI